MSLSDCEKCWDTPCVCGYGYRGYTLDQRLELARVVMGAQFEPLFLQFATQCREQAAQVCPVMVDPNAPLVAYQQRLDANATFYEKVGLGLVQPAEFKGASPFATGGAALTMDEQERMSE